jgi:Rrf2 family protein
MLTNKGKYGLKALVYLSRLEPDELALSSEIAEARDIPRKFLETILVELRNGGFVTSRKGKSGGYRLARAAGDIRVGSIIRTLDGTLAPISCASKSNYQKCDDCDESQCEVRRLMAEVRQAICDVLDMRSLAELSAQAQLLLLVDEPCP